MKNDDPELRMRLVERTPRAVKVTGSVRPPANPGETMFFHWIPRSMIYYSRTETSPVPGEFPLFTFTLPEWKIEQANLWQFAEPFAPLSPVRFSPAAAGTREPRGPESNLKAAAPSRDEVK